MNLYVGTSGYSYKEWKGTFYPEELPKKQMLRFYGERFRTVEINNTFYRMPKESVLEAWAAEVPADFKFVLKASQRITHMQRLKDAGDSVSYLLDVAGVLKERLGPLLFQLPPYLKKDAPRLREFLALLPPNRRAAFEFRHQSWFDPEVFLLTVSEEADEDPLTVVLELLHDVPAGKLAIAELRDATPDDVSELERSGMDAVLVSHTGLGELVQAGPPEV